MKSAIVCLVIAAVFVFVNAMPADGDTTVPTTTATNATTTAGPTTTPAGEETTTEPSTTPNPFKPVDLIFNIAKDVDSRVKSFFGQFTGSG